MPISLSAFSTISLANGSTRLSSRSPRTRSVTDDPSALIHTAASHETTPPPTMTSRSGTSSTPVASREPQGKHPSYVSGTVGSLPVAMTTA